MNDNGFLNKICLCSLSLVLSSMRIALLLLVRERGRRPAIRQKGGG